MSSESDLKIRLEKAQGITETVIGGAIEVHRYYGPGLLEPIYEKALAHELHLRGLNAVTQKAVKLDYKGHVFEETLRFDLLVEDCLLIEVKAVEALIPVHKAQLLSYMKLMQMPLGLLINFHEPIVSKGIRRLVLKETQTPESSETSEISL